MYRSVGNYFRLIVTFPVPAPCLLYNKQSSVSNWLSSIQSAQDRIYRLAARIVGEGAAADVTQEVLLAGWREREQLQQLEDPTGYLLKVTRHRAIDTLRSERTRQQRESATAVPDTHATTPHQLAETKDTLNRIERLMRELPEAQRSVLHLRDVEGFSYQEISVATGLTEAQVKTYLHRGRKALRSLLLTNKLYQP